jgi:Periplasmic protease
VRPPSIGRLSCWACAKRLAAADNAHTNVDARAWREQLSSVPVRLEWFADGLHIVRAREAFAELLGAHVTAIDGFEPSALVGDAARFFGGPKEFVRTASLVYLESPEAIHAVRPEAPADRLQLRIVDREGRERRVDLPALAPPQRPGGSKAGRLLSPVALADEAPGEWRTVLDPNAAMPPSLRAPERSVYATTLDEGTLYLHLWQIRDDATGPVDDGIRRAVGQGARWRRIVLDLRFDRGGDYPWAYSQMRGLPGHLTPDGRILVLLDNTTFSAAIIDAALARHFGAGRTTLIGEAPGDRLTFWAEGNSFVLPNSKLRVLSSTGYHDWAHGCRELRCYWPNFWYGVGVGNVDPEVRVAWSFEDYRRGIDSVLQRALER